MIRYEALMLAIPELTQDETKTIESQLENVVAQSGATMISFERWGKFRLAYPVKKNDYGIYFLARFEAPENPTSLLNGLRTVFSVKLNDLVMRNMVARLESHASLAYQRPHSLEEAPAKESGFFKEGRGGDFYDKGGKSDYAGDDEGVSA